MLRTAAILLALSGAGCSGVDSHVELGDFLVTASRLSSCAEQGVMAMPKKAVYRVSLSRSAERTLFWRESTVGLLVGDVGPDGNFAFDQFIRADMRPPGSKQPKCHVERDLDLTGTLTGEAPSSYDGLTGRLAYTFTPTADSSCDDLLSGADAVAAELPCTLELELQGEPE